MQTTTASKKIYLLWLAVVFPYLLTAQNSNPAEQVFTVDQLQEDLFYFRKTLENNHPNLYEYTPKKSIDSLFEAMNRGIHTPMSARVFYRYVSVVQSYVKDGHSHLLPSAEAQAYDMANTLYFPLNFVVNNNRAFVTQNFSDEQKIANGDELVELDGKPFIEIYNTLVQMQARDGANMCYPEWIVKCFFRSYFNFYYGAQTVYSLGVRHADGRSATYAVDGLSLDAIRAKRAAMQFKRYDRTDFEKGIFWEFDPGHSFALLSIKTWHNNLLRKEYRQQFKPEIRRFFHELDRNPSTGLIIDLRGNQGGDAHNGIFMLRRLMFEPFQYCASIQTYKRKGKLRNTAHRLTRRYKPCKKVFQGKIIVLTDGGSFSNSGMFASLMQVYGRGKTAGAETGGNAVLLAGGTGHFTFPNTRIQLLKADNRFVVTNKRTNTGRGVLPDYPVQPALEDILANRDIVLENAVQSLSENN